MITGDATARPRTFSVAVVSTSGMATEREKMLAGERYDPMDPESSGVSVGSRTIIGAGSVVTRDIPDSVLAAGNPCRVIREIRE